MPEPTDEMDLDSPVVLVDPYPRLADLRATQPVSWVRMPFAGGAWLVTDYRMGKAALNDSRISRRPPDWPQGDPVTLEFDPPEHTRLRRLVSGSFTHRSVRGLEQTVQAHVDRRLDEITDLGEAELMSALAYPLSLFMLTELLGVPESHGEEIFHSVGMIIEGETFEIRNRVYGLLREYVTSVLREKRMRPGAGLLDTLQGAVRAGALTPEELVELGITLIAAGFLTTANLISNGIHALLTHPDQMDLLRRRPELMESAVEESLRYESPFAVAGGPANQDFELGGQAIRCGEIVATSLLGANRDPRVFVEPDRFDITRNPNPHLAFAHGIHHCLGAPLARMECRIAVGSLVRRFPHIELAAPTGYRASAFRSLNGLLVAPGKQR